MKRYWGSYAARIAEYEAERIALMDAAVTYMATIDRLTAALEQIGEIQPKVLAYIRANGFVFEDLGVEPGNWQHLAFSIYSDLCEADSIARQAIESEN